jgi:hypothetical protein
MTFLVNSFVFVDGETISSGDVAGGEINLTGLDLSLYDDVRLYFDGVVPNADDNSLALQLVLGGSTISAGYRYNLSSRSSSNTTNSINSASAADIPLTPVAANFGIGTDTGECASGVIYLSNHSSSLIKLLQVSSVIAIPAGTTLNSRGGSSLDNSSNVTGFRFFCPDGGGSLVSGRVTVVGILKP